MKDRYSFLPSLSRSFFRNACELMARMSVWYYFARPTNLAFHDLTQGKIVPPAARSLLGMSLKFIPTPPLTGLPKDLNNSLDRFERDMQIKSFFAGSEDGLLASTSTMPKLYIRSKWTPPPWEIPRAVTTRSAFFRARIKQLFRCRKGVPNFFRFKNAC